MAQAYYVAGEAEEGIAEALAFGERLLGIPAAGNPDVVVLRFGLFSVDDARRLMDTAYRSASGDRGRVVVASATRIFHEAQNALLKLFEEPPEGVTLILVIPSAGLLLPTLRSRLLDLPEGDGGTESRKSEVSGIAQRFLTADEDEREKLIAKLLEQAKSDKDETKQQARSNAVSLIEGLMVAAYAQLGRENDPEEKEDLRLFLDDLSAFLPILHARSAPLKLIFEHLLLVIPRTLTLTKV
ncbi:MAG: hypothetical protein V4480_00680 [Patescibacteria group bacterium]